MPLTLRLLERLIENSPLSIQIVDENGLTVRANPAFRDLFSYPSLEGIIGHVNVLRDPNFQHESLRPYVLQAFQGETALAPPMHFETDDAAPRDIRATIFPIKDDAGAVAFVVLMFEDITTLRASVAALERRYALIASLEQSYTIISNELKPERVVEQTLLASERLFSCDAAAIWRYDPANTRWDCLGQRGLSPHYVPAVEEHTARPLDGEQSLGHRLLAHEVIASEDALHEPGFVRLHPVLQQEGQRRMLGLPLQIRDAVEGTLVLFWREPGKIDPLDIEAARLLADQAAIGLHNAELYEETRAMRNSLEEKVHERTEALREAHEASMAAERLAAVGILAREVAHNLRNPLNVISASVYYIRSRFPLPDDKINRHFDTVARSVEQAADTINQLMSLVDADIPDQGSVDLLNVVRRALSERADSDEVRWVPVLDEKVPYVSGDITRLTHVVKALLNNAASAAPPDSEVILRLNRQGSDVVFAVGDCRNSMTEDEVNSSFEPLFASGTRWTGLALSVARRIARKHGGDVICRSDETDSRTWFTLTLPVQDRSA